MKKQLIQLIVVFSGLLLALATAIFIGKNVLGDFTLPMAVAGILFAILTVVVLRRPFLGVCLLLFFLSYTWFPSVDLGGITVRIDQILILVATFSWLGDGFLRGRLSLQKDPLFPFLFLYLAFILSSYTWALNQSRAGMVLIFVLLVVLAYELMIQTISDKQKLTIAINYLLWGGLVVSLFGLWQFLGGGVGLPSSLTMLRSGYDNSVFGFPRVHAFSIEPLYFADYLFIPLFLGLSLFFTRQEKIKRGWLIVLLLAGSISFVLTLSRGAYLGFIVACLVLLLLIPRKILTLTNIIVFSSSIFVIIMLVVGVFRIIGPEYLDRFVSHALVSDLQAGESTQGRLTEYQRSLNVWHEYYWFGAGIGNYGPAAASNPFFTPDDGWPIVNNQYLETLAETGVIGFILLVGFWLAVIIRGIIAFVKSRNWYLKSVLAGLLAAFAGVLVQYNFFSTIYIVHIWILVGLLVAVENIVIYRTIKI